VLVEQGSIFRIEAGELWHQMGESLDLCSDCGRLFLDWLASGRSELPELQPVKAAAATVEA
jgi:hypothetical protein